MMDARIAFSAANSPFYKFAFDGAVEYGIGFIPPSQWELRTWILKAEVDDLNKIKENHMKSWK